MSGSRSSAEELALAEQCDARGDHDGAINALARATRLGDIEAATRLGKRLIVGLDAPFLPKEGIGFLFDAANQGGAEAPARLAVLAAAGIYLPQSLTEALKLLVAAAQRGWRPAQDQLCALAPDRDPVAGWQALADAIDPAFWRHAPARQVLSASPEICAFRGLIPEPVCDWLIERSSGRLNRALVYDPVSGKDYASEIRTNSWAQFDLMGAELIHLLVQLRMEAACGLPLHCMEATAILHYSVGEQISNHYDFVDPQLTDYEQELAKNGQRVLTFLIYLNDDYEGGGTEFPRLGLTHRGTKGEGLFFVNAHENGEPDTRTLHAGKPPTQGEKWVVSQFVRNRRVVGFVA
jgi:prolyl 4-hydroxylase